MQHNTRDAHVGRAVSNTLQRGDVLRGEVIAELILNKVHRAVTMPI
jgi:hypothetical protein